LHILRIPFTGLFIGGSAVIFITLLSYYSDSRNTIIESALKVMLVKFVVSPYTPINAYFSVFLQTIIGYLLFFNGFNSLSPIILGFLSLLLSAFQKVIITTLVFGMTLWESIDIFFDFVVSRIIPDYSITEEMTFSYIIVGTYIFIHIFGGLTAGWYASSLPKRINFRKDKIDKNNLNELNSILENGNIKKKRKRFWTSPTFLIILSISFALIIISFFYDEINQGISSQIIVMLVRSVIIILLWYYLISPYLLKLLNKLLSGKRKKRMDDINSIVNLFPDIKSVIKIAWSGVKSDKGLKKVFNFIDGVLISFLLVDKVGNGK
jgi:hypothetical protein